MCLVVLHLALASSTRNNDVYCIYVEYLFCSIAMHIRMEIDIFSIAGLLCGCRWLSMQPFIHSPTQTQTPAAKNTSWYLTHLIRSMRQKKFAALRCIITSSQVQPPLLLLLHGTKCAPYCFYSIRIRCKSTHQSTRALRDISHTHIHKALVWSHRRRHTHSKWISYLSWSPLHTFNLFHGANAFSHHLFYATSISNSAFVALVMPKYSAVAHSYNAESIYPWHKLIFYLKCEAKRARPDPVRNVAISICSLRWVGAHSVCRCSALFTCHVFAAAVLPHTCTDLHSALSHVHTHIPHTHSHVLSAFSCAFSLVSASGPGLASSFLSRSDQIGVSCTHTRS